MIDKKRIINEIKEWAEIGILFGVGIIILKISFFYMRDRSNGYNGNNDNNIVMCCNGNDNMRISCEIYK